MSQIRVVYSPDADGNPQKPPFPPEDQHPGARRYYIGDLVVDAIGGEPSPEEIDAVLNPPVEVKSLTEKLAAIGITLQALKEELSK